MLEVSGYGQHIINGVVLDGLGAMDTPTDFGSFDFVHEPMFGFHN